MAKAAKANQLALPEDEKEPVKTEEKPPVRTDILNEQEAAERLESPEPDESEFNIPDDEPELPETLDIPDEEESGDEDSFAFLG